MPDRLPITDDLFKMAIKPTPEQQAKIDAWYDSVFRDRKEKRMHQQAQTEAAVDRAKAAPTPPEFSPADRSPEEQMLRRLMRSKGMKANGHGYKNFAVVTATGVMDAHGFTPCDVTRRSPETGEKIEVEPFICHKRHLHRFVGPEMAARWWHKSLGVRARRH